jgi:hypothetical protein
MGITSTHCRTLYAALTLDSGQHRVLVVESSSGVVEYTVGTGQPGCCDGRLDTAEFKNPQGRWALHYCSLARLLFFVSNC